jgi:hypothetical protein
MGGTNSKQELQFSDVSQDCRKQYFKVMRQDLKEGLKLVKNTIHSANLNIEDNWIKFLLNKFTSYIDSNNICNNHIRQIVSYLQNMEESNEAKHLFNLQIYLAEIEDLHFYKRKQSTIIY